MWRIGWITTRTVDRSRWTATALLCYFPSMSTIDEIKVATAGLNPDEQVELFKWWVQSETFKARQLAALKRDLAVGLDQLDHGRYQTYNDTTVMQLAEEVGRSGRERLKGGPKSPPA
jgi:hypothetical protein